MKNQPSTVASTLILGAVALCTAVPGCAAGDAAAPRIADAAAPPRGEVVVANLVAHVNPRARSLTIERARPEALRGSGLRTQNLDDLNIIADGVAGSGPADTIELVTNSIDFNDQCPGYQTGTPIFCANVTLNHFFSKSLSDVFVEVTSVTDTDGADLAGHGAVNSDTSMHGLDAASLGLWRYTSAAAANAGIVGASPDNTASADWVFANPDDAVTTITLRVVASLYPTLWFNADGSMDQSAPLVAGQPGILHYDYARLTGCRDMSGWTMSSFFTGPTTYTHSITYPGQDTDTYFDVHFMVPFGDPATFSFSNDDTTLCQQLDPLGGGTYSVSPVNPSSVIHFKSDFTSSLTGSLTAGSPITIDYDLSRLPGCSGAIVDAYDRLPSPMTATMLYSFDGGTTQEVSLVGLPSGVPATINGLTGQLQVAPTLQIPMGTTTLDVSFKKTNDVCTTYDTNLGGNYTFAVN